MVTVGVFDHIDADGREIGAIYEDRLQLIEAYDRLGIHAYHLAEHHSTPLGLTPSPSVFLSAVAQRTKRLRLGPMVYTLGLYHPLRLFEEICMLDQLSLGRFELGIGKGISSIEQGFFGVDIVQTPAIFSESFAILMQGFKKGRIDFRGDHFHFTDVPVTMKCVQKTASAHLVRRGAYRKRRLGCGARDEYGFESARSPRSDDDRSISRPVESLR